MEDAHLLRDEKTAIGYGAPERALPPSRAPTPARE
jgi:hypothetical protein